MLARRKVLFAVLTLVLVGMTHGADAASPGTLLDGNWDLVSIEQNGDPLPRSAVAELRTQLSIAGDQYVVRTGAAVVERGRLDMPAAQRKAIDILPSEGVYQGKVLQAVFAMTGDTLTICYNYVGGERPEDFTTKSGSGRFLAVYRRAR